MITKGLSFKTAQSDIDKLDVIAAYIYRQPRAGALRLILMESITKYYAQACELKQQELQVASTVEEVKAIPVAKDPDARITVEPNFTATQNWGAPKACPACDAVTSTDGLDRPALNVMRSDADWGVWACHECFSTGRWYNEQPFIILENTCTEDELPLIQEKV